MRPSAPVGCLILVFVQFVFSGAAEPAQERKPVKPKFVVYATAEDAELRSSLFRVLRGTDNLARFDKADTIDEAVASEADVLVLVMPKRGLPQLKEATLQALKERKIIGIGYGAAQLFGRLGLEINGGACAHFPGKPPSVTVVSSQLLGEPKAVEPLAVLSGVAADAGKVDIFAMFLPQRGPDSSVVDAIARWTRDANYAPIVRQGNCVLIGIPVPVTQWSASYSDLVRDMCIALHARKLEAFTTARREQTKPGTYQFQLAKAGSTDLPFAKTFYFRFTEAARLSAQLEHAGSDSMMLLFMGEDEDRSHWTRRDARLGETLMITTDISQADIEKLGDRYWRLKVTNFGTKASSECKLTITIE